mmetsp:Transcript_21849/g.36166  ORF Transcript_21849/g.36166 Transcript_21849/m.36166 type:complete len:313 (-) Transcript_21849:19-957(-)
MATTAKHETCSYHRVHSAIGIESLDEDASQFQRDCIMAPSVQPATARPLRRHDDSSNHKRSRVTASFPSTPDAMCIDSAISNAFSSPSLSDPFDPLPDDLLLEILRRVCPAPSVFNLSVVCRRWDRVLASGLLSTCESFCLLKVRTLRIGAFCRMLSSTQNVRSVCLPLQPLKSLDKIFDSVYEHCPKLTSLSTPLTSDDLLIKLTSSCNMIEDITLHCSGSCTSSLLFHLCSCVNLRNVSLTGSIMWDPHFKANLDACVGALRKLCKTLVHLSVDLWCVCEDNSRIKYCAEYGPRGGLTYIRYALFMAKPQ